jgi:hypothetical protein
MIARLAGDRDMSKDVFLKSGSKHDASKKNEKEIRPGWQGVVNGTSITF